MGNGLNVRRVTAYGVHRERRDMRKVSVCKVRLNSAASTASTNTTATSSSALAGKGKVGKRAGAVSLTKRAQARIRVIPDAKEAVLTVLESGPDSEASRDIIVTQHQLQSLKSNPTANTALTRKQMKKLKSRAKVVGLLAAKKSAMKI